MSVQAPSAPDLRQEVHDAARRARVAARRLATLPTAVKDRALHAAADELLANCDRILAANAEDIEGARATDTPSAMLDRLGLNPQRIDGIAVRLRQVAGLPDPVGEVLRGYTLPNGLDCRQQRVPLGVVGMVYEARPNVTVDAFGLALKSGNAVLLRGSLLGGDVQCGTGRGAADRLAARTAADAVQLLPSADRSSRHPPDPGPRPGRRGDSARRRGPDRRGRPRRAGAHHRDRRRQLPRLRARGADLDMAERILINAKTRRPSVCNTAETVLVDAAIAEAACPA